MAEAYPDASLIAFRGPERAVVFAASQAPRPDAAETMARLAARGFRIEILSGDRAPRRGKPLRRCLNVAKWSAALKPADKIARLEGAEGARA